MLRLSKRKAGNVGEGAQDHTCKMLFIFVLWYKGLLYIGHFLQSLTDILCLSPISFWLDLFIPNKKKKQKNCCNIGFFCELYAGDPVQVIQISISSYLKEPTALKTTKRTV